MTIAINQGATIVGYNSVTKTYGLRFAGTLSTNEDSVTLQIRSLTNGIWGVRNYIVPVVDHVWRRTSTTLWKISLAGRSESATVSSACLQEIKRTRRMSASTRSRTASPQTQITRWAGTRLKCGRGDAMEAIPLALILILAALFILAIIMHYRELRYEQERRAKVLAEMDAREATCPPCYQDTDAIHGADWSTDDATTSSRNRMTSSTKCWKKFAR